MRGNEQRHADADDGVPNKESNVLTILFIIFVLAALTLIEAVDGSEGDKPWN